MALGNDLQESSKFCLKWDGFHSNITSVFENLRQDEEFVDITLCCDGMKLKAHKMMLSAASPYFRDLLKENPCQHPVFFMRDTRSADMAAIIEFVYRGSVNVSQAQLASFIQTAELLQIRGLSGDDDGKQRESRPPSVDPVPAEPAAAPSAAPHWHRASPGSGAATPPTKRRRVSATPSTPAAAAAPETAAPPPQPQQSKPHPPPQPQPLDQSRLQQQLSEVQEVLVKQEKVEDSEDAAEVYDSVAPSSLEQMMFVPQHPQVMPALTPSSGPVISSHVNTSSTSEEPSQASAAGSRVGHSCPVCGQKYWSLASLHNHISLHRGNTKCPICGQTCSTTSNRNRHMANKHPAHIYWRNAGGGGGVKTGGGGGGGGRAAAGGTGAVSIAGVEAGGGAGAYDTAGGVKPELGGSHAVVGE